jgi:MEDS: MEthanogen/methylotroph, DcmR Sensory domain
MLLAGQRFDLHIALQPEHGFLFALGGDSHAVHEGAGKKLHGSILACTPDIASERDSLKFMSKCARCGTETELYVNGQPRCIGCDSAPGKSSWVRSDVLESSTPLPRHQCLIYDGSPSKHLEGMAALIAKNLTTNIRCLYLDSPPMVAAMRSYLAAAGLDVADEVAKGSLLLSSDQDHLVDGFFDAGRMLDGLVKAVGGALDEGYRGLWATGDMTWELGGKKNFAKLLEYECGLEDLFTKLPALSGICQYHRDTLPLPAIQDALYTHRAVYVSETLTRLNPYYGPRQSMGHQHTSMSPSALEAMLNSIQEPRE